MESIPRTELNRQKISQNFKTMKGLIKTLERIQTISKLIVVIFFLGFFIYLFSSPIFSYKPKELFFISTLTGLLLGLTLNHDSAVGGVMKKLVIVTSELFDELKENPPFQETETPDDWTESALVFLNRLSHLSDSYRVIKYFRPFIIIILFLAFYFPFFLVLAQPYFITNVILLSTKILALFGCFAFYGNLNEIPGDYLIRQTEPENSDFTTTLYGVISALDLFKPKYWATDNFTPKKIHKGISLLCNSMGKRIRDTIAYRTGIIKSIEVAKCIATLHLAVLSERKPETLDPIIILDNLRQNIKGLDPKGTLDQLVRIETEYVNILNAIDSLELTFFSTKTTWYTLDFPEKVKTVAVILGILVAVITIVGRFSGLFDRLFGT